MRIDTQVARRRAFLLALCCAVLGAGQAQGELRQTFAVVIGNNHSLDEDLPSLAFADDDAAKYHEFFIAAGARVRLFTVLDPEAQRLFPAAAEVAVPPTLGALWRGLAELRGDMQAARDAGARVDFYFVYAGHGGVGPNNEGYLSFLDGRLGRADFYRLVIEPSPASFNHVILDACGSYFVVAKRGGDRVGDYSEVVRSLLRREDLASHPTTGVILATSADAQTHEWSAWEAGLFSHELRSALLGAGDVNGDRRVSYAEAAACVEAANAAVVSPKHRLKVFFRPPAAREDEPLFDLERLTSASVLRLDAPQAGRYDIEDSRGVRVADIHSAPLEEVTVALLGEPPFFVRSATQEARIEASLEPISLAGLTMEPRSSAARGAAEESFRRLLYTVPFGRGFLEGALASGFGAPSVEPLQAIGPSDRGAPAAALGWSSLGLGLVAVASGTVFYGLARASYREYEDAVSPASSKELHVVTHSRTVAGNALVIGGGVLAATGVALLVVSARQKRQGPERRVSWVVVPVPAGASGVWSLRF